MFESLSTRLQDVFKSLSGQGRLTPENIEAALREIRLALLEADVNFKVVKAFIDRVRDKAMEDGPAKPVAVAAGREDRPRRDARALRRHEGRAQREQQAAAGRPAARTAGRRGRRPPPGSWRSGWPGRGGIRCSCRPTSSGRPRSQQLNVVAEKAGVRCTIRLARSIRWRAPGGRWPKPATGGSTSSSSTRRGACTSTTS